ncbi:outer membrane beta-barrel protein [Pedobacter paludis]|uniref:Outer membrane protein beta-barrel domain-containing protein n=1 Tax=Pedobacter paludis TaxID=2203212 RepID=A0A317F1K1_9SPHI|nr:outer membrane beta-barrel protein [Pedobacter paludis]PWS31326.1 hypothetical protein DF947_12025 [Pedobacter paludis]
MKKVLLSLLMVVGIGFVANAQTEKGSWMVGAQAANINYNTTSEVFSFSLSPQAGYFVKDNLAIGGKLSLDIVSASGSTATSWGIGPFVRGYFGGTEKAKFFAEGNVGLGGISYSGASSTAYNLGATVGYAYFITKNVGLETGLGYGYSNSTSGGMSSSDLGLNLGFQIYLGKRK